MRRKIECAFELLIIDWNEKIYLKHDTLTAQKNEWCNFEWDKFHEDMIFDVYIGRTIYDLNISIYQIAILHSEMAKAASYSVFSEKGFIDCLETRINAIRECMFYCPALIDPDRLMNLLMVAIAITSNTETHSWIVMELRSMVVHLCAWIIRTFGEKTDEKQKVIVYDDNGREIEGTFNVYTASFPKDTFAKNVEMWVKKYVECNGQFEN
eukprot:455613_1